MKALLVTVLRPAKDAEMLMEDEDQTGKEWNTSLQNGGDMAT